MQSDQIEHQVDAAVESALLRKDVELLTAKVEKLSVDVEALVTAWKTAGNVVTFIKWLSGGAIAVVTLYSLFKTYVGK
jgi:hypothetical protein